MCRDTWFARWVGCLPMLTTLILICATSTAIGQTKIKVERIQVSDKQGGGVPSKLLHQHSSSNDVTRLNPTDESGLLELNPPYEVSRFDTVRAVPVQDNLYFEPSETNVEEEIKITVFRRPPDENASTGKVSLKLSRNDKGNNLLFFTELAARSRKKGFKRHAADAELQVYLVAAEILDVDVPAYFDKDRNRLVPSEKLENSIKTYQSQNQLEVNGKLNSQTVQALAGKKFWSVLYGSDPETGIMPVSEPALPPDFADRIREFNDPILSMLAINVVKAKKASQWGLASLLLNELTSRLREFNSDASKELAVTTEVETYRLIGKALSIDKAVRYDPVQSRFVMAPLLSSELRKLQQETDLKPTGQVDYVTLRSLAKGTDVGSYLFSNRFPELQ